MPKGPEIGIKSARKEEGMVARDCNPSTWEAEARRQKDQGWPGH